MDHGDIAYFGALDNPGGPPDPPGFGGSPPLVAGRAGEGDHGRRGTLGEGFPCVGIPLSAV